MGVKLLTRSFAGGEITPELADRVDLGQYQTGLSECVNGIIYPHGVVEKRAGTRFVNRTKYYWQGEGSPVYDRNVKLIPFQFSDDQSSVIELGHKYIRFHSAGGTLLAGTDVVVEDITSIGVKTGTPKRIVIAKKNHGLLAGKKIKIVASPKVIVGQYKGTIAAGADLPMLAGIKKNDYWQVTSTGTLLGRNVNSHYLLRAKGDDPYDIAVSTGEISGTTFTDTTHVSGTFVNDMSLFTSAVDGAAPVTKINALSPTAPFTGTGANSGGTYGTNSTVSATGQITITGRAYNSLKWELVPVESWSQFDGTAEYTVENAGEDGAVDPDAFAINVDSSLTGGTPPVKAFTRITRAKEAVVKSAAHGFSNGDIVYFSEAQNKNQGLLKKKFNMDRPYMVSDATVDQFKIKVFVTTDDEGNGDWIYLDTKKDFAKITPINGKISSTAFVPDSDTADATYTIIRTATSVAGGENLTQASHGFYTGQTVWFDPVADYPWNRKGWYEVTAVDGNTFTLKEPDGDVLSGPGVYDGVPVLAGYVYPVLELPTEYVSDDVMGVDYVQSYDVVTLTHKNYPPATLSRLNATEWELEDVAFLPVTDIPVGLSAKVTGTGGTVRAVYYAVTTEGDGEESFPAYAERAPFTVSEISGRIKYCPVPSLVGNDYFNDPLPNAVSYYGQGIKLASGFIPLGAIIRLEAGDSESGDFITAIEGTEANDNFYRVEARLQSGWYVLKRRSGVKFNWVLYEGELDAGSLLAYRNGSVNADFDAGYKVSLSWRAKPDAVYNVYKRVGGAGGDALGFIGRTKGGWFVDDGITPDLSITPPFGDSPFAIDGNYPACVDYFEQRKVFAGTNNRPQSVWLSRIARDNNMMQSLPVRDTDAITFRIAAREQSRVRFMAAINDLLLFSGSGIFRVSATDGTVLTPATVSVKQQVNTSVDEVKPVPVGGSVLFVQAGSNRVLRLGYDWNAQSYSTEDLSILSFHLFNNRRVVGMSVEHSTFTVVWVVLDDGSMVMLSYEPSQNIVAWSKADSSGAAIESVSSVRSGAGSSQVYLVLARGTAAGGRKFIEMMDNFCAADDRIYSDQYTKVLVSRDEGGALYDPAAKAVMDRFTVAPSTALADKINGLVIALKAAGVWENLDSLYVAKGLQDTQSARLDWRHPTRTATIAGSASWNATDGFCGSNTAGSYISTGYAPGSDAVHFSQNNAGAWCYLTGLPTTGATEYLFGVADGSRCVQVNMDVTNSYFSAKINSFGGGDSANGTAGTGLIQINRTASGVWNLYRNAASILSDTDTSNSTLVNYPVYIGAQNSSGTPFSQSDAKIGAVGFGASLTTQQQTALKAALEVFWS